MAAQAGIGPVPSYDRYNGIASMLASPSVLLQHEMLLHCERTSALKTFQTSLPLGSFASVWGRTWRLLVTIGSYCHHRPVIVPGANSSQHPAIEQQAALHRGKARLLASADKAVFVTICLKSEDCFYDGEGGTTHLDFVEPDCQECFLHYLHYRTSGPSAHDSWTGPH